MKRNKRKNIKRLICFVLMFCMLSQNSMQTVLAWPGSTQDTEQENTDTVTNEETELAEDATEESSIEPEILDEIEENRGEFSKEYLLSDNSRTVVVYPQQIHYETADGKMAEIDNSLIKTEEGYQNGSNSYEVLITDNEDSQGEVIYKEDDYEIAWQMVEVSDETEETENETHTEPEAETKNQPEEAATDVSKEDIVTPQLDAEVTDDEPETALLEEDLEEFYQVKQSKVTFDGYDNGVSVEYEPTGDGIKENIILPTRESGSEYLFSVQLKGLKARLSSANEIEFYDENTDEIEYYFPAPFMIDAEGEVSYAAKYKLVDLAEVTETESEEQETESETEEPETETEEPETESETEESETESEETETETEVPGTEPEESEAEPETESVDETESESETEPESETETEETVTEPESEIGSEEIPTETETEIEPKPEETTGLGEEVEQSLVTEAVSLLTANHTEAVSSEETVTETDNKTESESDSEAVSETGSESSGESGAESEPSSEPKSETESTPEPSGETEPKTENESSSETGMEPEKTSEPEIVPVVDDDTLYIKIVLDEEWLDQAAYPVTVDPVLKQARTKNLLDYGCVASNDKKFDTLYVGKNDADVVFRSFVRFDLPEMEKQSIVSKALLYLNGTIDTANTHYLTANIVTEEWYNKSEDQQGKELSWSEQPKTGNLLDYHVNAGNYNITKAVHKWLSGEQENYGIAFTAYNENAAQRDTIRLRTGATTPYLKITYRTAVGLESYWGTHATGAGTAGAGYVNDYTGALTVINTDVVTAGNRFPMSIGHVYNSNVEKNNGWRLNYEQTIKIPLGKADIATYPYVYTDQDGTEHYFKKSDVKYQENGAEKEVKATETIPPAKDEDGLKLFIVPVTDKTLKEKYPLKMVDKSSSLIKYFDKMGRLAMIADSNQHEDGSNSSSKEKNCILINYENVGENISLSAFDEAIAAAQTFRDTCYTSGIKVDSTEYTEARDHAVNCINILKTDSYAVSDLKTARQVNKAVVQMSNLTDTASSPTKATAKTTSDTILEALKNAKEKAEALADESGKKIHSVMDAVGNEAVFTYDENGRIHTISDPTYEGGKVNTYTYDSEGNLTQITFANGKNAYYTYDESNLLVSQKDHDGYRVEYTYGENDDRIQLVKEAHNDTPGQTYSIQYNTDNTTTFRFSGVDDAYGTDDDIENIHVFDAQGRAVCIYSKKVGEDKVLGATACSYEATTSEDGTENTDKRNKIKDTAVVGMHANNLLTNHSFEYSDKNWVGYKNTDQKPETDALNKSNDTRKYLGDKSAFFDMSKRTGGVAGFKQEVELDAGTYTFSGYCKAGAIKNTDAYLKVTDASGNSWYSNKITEKTNIEFSNGWERLEVTFTIETPQTVTACVETNCSAKNTSGTLSFDCVQLETGNVANDYNILEDGSFELTEEVLPYKAKNYTETKVKVEDAKEDGGVDGEHYYHITGQPGKDKFLRFNTNLGSEKKSFVLSGWIKTNSTPIRTDRAFKVVAYHTEETEEAIIKLKIEEKINAYSEGWKYFTMILPAASWKDTTITFRFHDNIGDLYIDGLQLTCNDVQTKKYDEEGNVVSLSDLQSSADYKYDSFKRLKKQTSATGVETSYTYAKNNATTQISSTLGPDTYMKYDKYGNQISNSSYDPDAETKLELYSEKTYTEDGNFEKTSTDNAGNVTTYEYNSLTGQLEKTLLPKRSGDENTEVDYIYDEDDRISAVTQGGRTVSYQYGEFDDLTGITHNGFSYNYTYDEFGNVVDSTIAGTTICTNIYAPNNGGHVKSIYPDGTETGTTYDEYGKITSNSLDGNIITKYVYDNDGNVAKKTDVLAGVTTKFDYNDSNMLVRSEVYDGDTTASDALESRMQYTYNTLNKVSMLSYQETDDEVRTYTYKYTNDGKPKTSTLPDGSFTTWNYDSLRRNNQIIHTPKEGAADEQKLYTVLKYQGAELTTADGKSKSATTGIVNRYVNKFGSSGTPVNDLRYEYDSWGNITKITEQAVFEIEEVGSPEDGEVIEMEGEAGFATYAGGLATLAIEDSKSYTYNALGEVVTAKECYSNGTSREYSYTYDEGGNILTETVNDIVHTYTYDSVWKDKLTAYDGKSITYDVFGCPTDYMGSTMTWDIYGGLTSVDNGTDKITYTYMGDGQRRSKTVNGVTTTYHYNNGMLLSETTGDETLRYYYDSTGKVTTLVYQKGDEKEVRYFYTRNAQGDIIGLYRSGSSELVGTYEYDLWGNLISITPAEHVVDDRILTKNPFRYRGYYYDNETGFYYLTARYYDPQIRRFISADSMNALMIATTDVTCKNLFAYAENNPVTGKDASGTFVDTVFDVISLTSSIVEVCKKPTDPLAWACLAGDAVDLIVPGVAGIGEAIRGAKTVATAAGAVGAVAGVAADATKTSKAVDNIVDGVKDLGKDLKSASTTAIKPYTNGRPSFRNGVVEEVWEKAKGPDGLVRDPNTGDVINWNPGEPRKDVWDMGHLPEAKYSDMHEAYMNDELTTKEFVEWYNDPSNYRPELPGNNRSHKYE